MYSHVSEVNWICKRKSKTLRQRDKKGEAWKEKERRRKNTGSLNEYVEKRPGIGTDTPHHTTVETLTSPLSLFPPCHHSFSPSLFPSFHLLCHCTWPLHFLSLHFLSFTPFSPSLIISLHHLLPPPLPLRLSLQLNSSFSSVCLPQSVSFLNLTASPSLLSKLLTALSPPLFPSDFSFYAIKSNLYISLVHPIVSISLASKC